MYKIKSKITYIFITIVILSFILPFTSSLAADSIYVWSNGSDAVPVSVDTTGSPTAPTPTGNFLNLSAGGSVLMDQATGKILYEKNPHEQFRPASVTKVMTLLLIMEAVDSGKLKLTDMIPCPPDARAMGGSQIWLAENEELSVSDMLKAICVVSANDCAVAMADYLSGSQDAFVAEMNAKAKELGMNDTTFKNCHGIDEDGHVTSAYDIAIMSRELMMKHPSISKYTTIWMDTLRDGKSSLVNTNKLVRNYTGCTGLKTGSTSIALYNLSATATRENLSLIAVIMRADTSDIRFFEAQKLLDYGFKTYEYTTFAKQGEILKSLLVNKGTFLNVNAVYENDSGTLIPKGTAGNVITQIKLDDKISAPVSKGQKLGEVQYLIDNQIVASTNLVADATVKRLTLPNMMARIFENWFWILR
ncbi:MAG: D-alanyl-D-alanine carboxypeptidase [Firmicutes bacterium]|nr:D-alanyl-D-alanine carboxypeptidase [Bacillota bacterium]